jgi:polar amino acid transport system substrate-binding protein
MARRIGVRGFLCATIVVVCAISGRASAAEPLRLVTSYSDLSNDKAPGFDVEVLRQVFAVMGQDVSFETFPYNRLWTMVSRGERDGMFSTLHTSERERICSFPDEPVVQVRMLFFVRMADVGKLTFSSFDDLVGHDVAIIEPTSGVFEQPILSPELLKFLRENHNMVETTGGFESFRMLAAGRVDYAVLSLRLGMRYIEKFGLSGKIEPLLSPSAFEGGTYLCFSKARVSPALVDAFSQALRQFKQTEAYQAIYRKYFP